MRSLRLNQFKVIALLFAGYAALYFCRADLSVGTPLIVDELGRHGVGHDEAVKRIGDVTSIGVFAYAVGKLFLTGLGDFWGGRTSFLIGLAGVGLLLYTKPFGEHVVPTIVYALLVGVATLFGAWEGGLVGIDSEHKKLEKFHDDLVAGKYLILVYVRKHREQVVLDMMRERHPDAELVGIDSHYVNPFSTVTRVSGTQAPGV